MARNHKYYRRIYEKITGEKIPDGWHIHHLDGDKNNNDFGNLICVSPKSHFEIHRLNYEKYGDKRDYFSMTYLQKYLDEKIDFSKWKRPPISEKHRQAIKKANTGRTHPNYLENHSEETKRKMREHRQKYGTWNSTKCKDIKTGKEYISFSQAEKDTGLVRKTKTFNERIICIK